MKVFVTGANGFVGSNLVRELIKRKYEVTGLVLTGLTPSTIENHGIDIVYGDILDKKKLLSQVKGHDILIHTAANLSLWPYRNDFQKKINVLGTKNVIQAVLKNKLNKYIHVGTANSFGYGSIDSPGDETTPYNMDKYGMDYMDSKYKAQTLVLNTVKLKNLPGVIVNPGFMFGPYSSEGGAKLIKEIYNKRLPGYTLGGRNYVCVKDVCFGIVNSIKKGKIGECYILGNKNLSYNEVFSMIANIANVSSPKVRIPKFIAKLYSQFLVSISKVNNKPPKLTPKMVDISFDYHFYSAKKAVNELNLPQTSIEKGIKESIEWMKKNNKLGG